jgi:polar amino acid transport system permease protein
MTTPPTSASTGRVVDEIPEITRVVPLRRPATWVAAVVLLVLVAMLAHTLLFNPRFEWDVVARFFTSSAILFGLLRTLELTAVSMAIGIVLGCALALMRLSRNAVVSGFASTYVWFFRGTPMLVQLIFLYNISALYPKLSLGVPFGPAFVSGNVNHIVTPFLAAIIGLGLNEGAFMCEIVRAGILSVDPGQVEAGQVLGMTRRRITRRIVLPQAARFVIPPTANQVIAMLKNTSIVSVIALPELLYSAQIIYTRDFTTIPLLIVASLWYLIVTSVLTVGEQFIERRFGGSDLTGRMRRFAVPRLLRGARGGAAA